MAALSCEICGGKLMAKAGGIFECDSCGMMYDKTRIQEMVQEIKGTVKVEGTVQVAGTVKVEGSVNVENFLKRGQLALEQKNFKKAEQFFDEALNLDAECDRAYLGKYCATRQETCIDDLMKGVSVCEDVEYVLANPNIQMVKRFSRTQETADFLEKLNEVIRLDKEHLKNALETLPAIREKIAPVQNMIGAGGEQTIGLRSNGTVCAVGYNDNGACAVDSWKSMKAVCVGNGHTVGLRENGTVVAIGRNDYGQCNVKNWTNIVAIAAGAIHTVGLRADGTVVATGSNDYGECGPFSINDWNGIVAIYAGPFSTAGLRSDGTVVVTGFSDDEMSQIKEWRDVIAICTGSGSFNKFAAGLRSNGTVLSVGFYSNRIARWRDIVAICAGDGHVVGLRADGTVVVERSGSHYGHADHLVEGWSNIVAIGAGEYHTVGLKSDGTVVAVGGYKYGQYPDYGQCNVSGWKLFNTLESIEQEREEAKSIESEHDAWAEAEKIRLEEDRKMKRLAELLEKNRMLNVERSNLKGIFSGKRRQEIETRRGHNTREVKKLCYELLGDEFDDIAQIEELDLEFVERLKKNGVDVDQF